MKTAKKYKLKKKFSEIKIPVHYLIIASVFLIAYTFFVTRIIYNSPSSNFEESNVTSKPDYDIRRLSHFKFIRPLLSAKPKNEFPGYQQIKDAVSKFINENQNNGILSTASVYFRDFDKSNWIVINPGEKYYYGSLFKLPVLISVLKMEESHPGFLKREIFYPKDLFADQNKDQEIKSKQIQPLHTYTYEQLLYYMIVYSDNSAYWLLENILHYKNYVKVLQDLNLQYPDSTESVWSTTAGEVSTYMEVLFNSSYLGVSNSEYAINLLEKSEFKDGIIKGIPEKNIFIAHKFAEAGDIENRQLHETALLYIKGKPYLITIMTKGKNGADYSKLEPMIQKITNIIYNEVVKLSNTQS
jgi:beta-lactamase class A